MELVSGVNFARIEWCCQKAGTTPDRLAADVGISAATFERAKSGEPSVTFDQLRQIGKHFGHGALFFLEVGPVDETTFSLVAKEVLYYSPGDENAFFAWLDDLQCVSASRGVGHELQIRIGRPTDAELRELIALFYRYSIEMTQLAQCVTPQNASWFRDDRSTYWYTRIFGPDGR